MTEIIIGIAIGGAVSYFLVNKTSNEKIESWKRKADRNEEDYRNTEKDKQALLKELHEKERELKKMREKLYNKEDLADDTAEDLSLLQKKYENAKVAIEKLQYENAQLKDIINSNK